MRRILIGLGWLVGSVAAAAAGAEPIQLEQAQPYYGDIAEDQAFILRFNQAIDKSEVVANSYCASSVLGEQIPLRLLPEQQAQELLTDYSYGYSENTADLYVVAQCAQRLAPSSSVRVHLYNAQQHDLVPTAFKEDQTGLLFTVRTPLQAQLICSKTKSTADCNPLLPLQLRFSAPVSADIAQQIQLTTVDGRSIAAQLVNDPQSQFVDVLSYPAPLVAQTELTWSLPSSWSGLVDDAGRALHNPDFFQQPVKIAALPPLLKFAHEGVGVLERFSDAPATTMAAPALLPLAVRGVEPSLLTANQQQSAGDVRQLHVSTPAEMFRWYARLQQAANYPMPKNRLEAAWHLQDSAYNPDSPQLNPQEISIFDFLQLTDQTTPLSLPAAPTITDKDIELIGVPLAQPGFHVVEAASARLGHAYSNEAPNQYVRSAALVTNLAVHSKLSDSQLVVWVTRLDNAQPVAGAEIQVLSCDGSLVAQGLSNAQGIWHLQQPLATDYCSNTGLSGYFVAASIEASHADAYGQVDSSFVMTSWDEGLETWRFQLPYYYAGSADVAHTVTDRSLFLAGETVHLKHYWRGDTSTNVSQWLPDLVVQHTGSGDQIKQKLQWQQNPTGGWYALSTIDLAKNTTLGQYEVRLQGDNHDFSSASFEVAAFKLPYLTGTLALSPSRSSSTTALMGGEEVQLDVQLSYLSGGVAANQELSISALTQATTPSFVEYEDYRFTPANRIDQSTVIIDKRPVILDDKGAEQTPIQLAPTTQPQELVVEASFMDPNGQIQSLSQRQTVWPADLAVGVKHPYWEQGEHMLVQGVVVDTAGQPVVKQPVMVTGKKQIFYTTRQRMVGGFYRYDSQEKQQELGELCQTQTNEKGEWQCDVQVPGGGQIVLHSQSTDAAERSYITETQFWLGGETQPLVVANHDRMDVIADKKQADPGDTVRFQVTMPFKEATALVAVEQGEVLYKKVVQLTAEQPFFDLTVQDDWQPNVYVSVLALRGRIYPTTWRDFFNDGWKTPLAWYQQYRHNDSITPSTTIDLAKPSFRYGIAQLAVGNMAKKIHVSVTPEQPVYQLAEMARVKITALLPDAQPAAQASVLLVGVDQALLELMPNGSWDLLTAMYRKIGYGVRTATMQSEVIGRRHYGRKAVPAGGGGGRSAPTREVVDSLLVWNTEIVLDDQGQATVEIPLNHSLTQFELVALVDSGGTLFGEAHAQIQTHQPVQIMSALPAEVRTGDQYQATFTVRNREDQALQIKLSAQGFVADQPVIDFSLMTKSIAAQSSAAFSQWVQMPNQLGANQGQIRWEVTAVNVSTDEVVDRLVFEQAWQALVPVRTQQVIWQRLLPNQPQSFELSVPATALTEHGQYVGGLQLHLQPTLGGQQTALEWFAQYPYTCFEQQASKYVALQDASQWQRLMQELPSYLDHNNLLRYFPSPYLTGSAGLNAYVLSLSAYSPSDTALPTALAQRLLAGLQNYVEGRRDQPRVDVAEQVAFYMSAVESIARYDLARTTLLDTIALAPSAWPTSALIDGLRILQHPVFATYTLLRQDIQDQLVTRLVQRGTTLMFSADNPLNRMPSLMVSPVTNQAKLLLTVAELPDWQDRIPGLMHGLLAQQYKGRWRTTTENSWALVALAHLDQHVVANGQTVFDIGGHQETRVSWSNDGTATFSQIWDWEQNGPVHIVQEGNAPIWLQLQAEAAVPVTTVQTDGYELRRSVIPIQQAKAGQWQVGDIYEVEIVIQAENSSVWAVVNDAVPAGATILGSGLGRDSTMALANQSETQDELYPSYTERLYSGYRAYIASLPAGQSTIRYRVQLNTAGTFMQSPTQIESLYDASVQAQLPVDVITVHETTY